MEFEFGDYKLYMLLLILGLIGIEMLWSWKFEKGVYETKETLANFAIFIGFQLTKLISVGYQLAIFGFISQFKLFDLEKLINPYGLFALTFIVVDLSYYWFHRCSHEIKFLWAFHLVHHSSPYYNLTTSYRLNWLGFLISPLFYLPIIFLGFPAESVILCYTLNLFYQFFVHTEAVGKLGFLEYVIDTPSNHRVHHGSNEVYIDKNYGGVLMIWDLLFGTYEPENEKVKYGITTGFIGHNPFVLVFQGFIDFFRNRMNYKG